MKTDDLLGRTTARPWDEEDGVPPGIYDHQLSCRAVNSFEAMREVLKRANAVAVFEYGPHDCDCDKSNEDGCDICAIRAALKLADGEA